MNKSSKSFLKKGLLIYLSSIKTELAVNFLVKLLHLAKNRAGAEGVKLIYPGSTTASHILKGGCFDKAIRAHVLIDAAIYQHVMKHVFTEEEFGEMRTLMEEVANKKLGTRHTSPIVTVFEERFQETFKKLAKGGRTPALWVQYHYLVDVIKIFIRTERTADHSGHLSCIVTWMLDIFAAAGHHQYAKGAQLYCQLMKQLSTLPSYKEIFQNFTSHGHHVVRYSCHDWSGTWCDICIEQTLMKAAKLEGGLNKGRMKNRASGHKCWVQTLNHFSDVNQRMEEIVKREGPLHKDLGETRMKRDAEVVELALTWFDENNPFDHDRDKQLLVSFSTGFTSTTGDAVNAERAAEVARQMQIKLDEQSVTSTMEMKLKVQSVISQKDSQGQ